MNQRGKQVWRFYEGGREGPHLRVPSGCRGRVEAEWGEEGGRRRREEREEGDWPPLQQTQSVLSLVMYVLSLTCQHLQQIVPVWEESRRLLVRGFLSLLRARSRSQEAQEQEQETQGEDQTPHTMWHHLLWCGVGCSFSSLYWLQVESVQVLGKCVQSSFTGEITPRLRIWWSGLRPGSQSSRTRRWRIRDWRTWSSSAQAECLL